MVTNSAIAWVFRECKVIQIANFSLSIILNLI